MVKQMCVSKCMGLGADGHYGAPAAPRVVSGSGGGTGVATTPGRRRMVITATGTILTTKSASTPTAMVSLIMCIHSNFYISSSRSIKLYIYIIVYPPYILILLMQLVESLLYK